MRAFDVFDYMQWARSQQGRYRHDLSVSGMAAPDLAWDTRALSLDGIDDALRAQAKQAIAAEYGVAPDQVVLAAGTSEANFLVALMLLRPGDALLVENPCYQVLARVAGVVGSQAYVFERGPEQRFAIDLESIRRAWRKNVKLIAITSPHNPSGFAADPDTLRELAEWLERHDAYALVDEVYRDFAPDPAPVAQAIHPRLISTASLSKVYGLGALRAGWALMPPSLVRRAEQLYDFLAVNPAAIPWRLALQAWPSLPALRTRAQTRARDNRAELAAWLARGQKLKGELPPHGIVAFLAAPRTDTLEFHEELRERANVLITPGDYFGAPGWVRLAYGSPPERFREALTALEAAAK